MLDRLRGERRTAVFTLSPAGLYKPPVIAA
jgi:hypothetical protein